MSTNIYSSIFPPNVSNEVLDILAPPGQSVLEIGTSTGEFALAAAHRCLKVHAVDPSAGMVR